MKNCIFLTFDDAYSNYARICLNSFETNYPEHPPIKIIYTGNDPEIKAVFTGRPNVEVIDYKLDMSLFKDLNLGQIGSPMIYARFILWTDIFEAYDNVLYLDCDTIILKPFPEVFEHEDFFSVSDNGGETVFLDDKIENQTFLAALEKDQMKLEVINNAMINSGFFLLPKKYRIPEHLEQIWRITTTYNEYIRHSDQSVISIWMHLNNIESTDQYQYNFQTHFILRDTVRVVGRENIKIMHYSAWKPDKNFQDLFESAKYVINVMDAFNKYNKIGLK